MLRPYLPEARSIHTVGPVARGHVGSTETSDLTSCYQNSLRLVKEHGLSTVVSTLHYATQPLEENNVSSVQLESTELCAFVFRLTESKRSVRKAVSEKFGEGTRTKGFRLFCFRYSFEKT